MAVKNFGLGVWCQFYSQKLPYILENSQKKFGVNTTKLRLRNLKKASPAENWTFGVRVFKCDFWATIWSQEVQKILPDSLEVFLKNPQKIFHFFFFFLKK